MLALAVGVFTWPPAPSNVLSFSLATVVSYLLNRRWTWGRRGRSTLWQEVLPFCALSLASLIASTLAVLGAERVLSDLSHGVRTAGIMLASLVAYGIVWGARFAVMDRYLFREETA